MMPLKKKKTYSVRVVYSINVLHLFQIRKFKFENFNRNIMTLKIKNKSEMLWTMSIFLTNFGCGLKSIGVLATN